MTRKRLLAEYREAVEKLLEAKREVKHWETEVEEHERRLSVPTEEYDEPSPIPPRFEPVMRVLRRHRDPVRLSAITNELGTLTTAGVRAQLVTLMNLGHVMQIDRGLYQANQGGKALS